MDSQPKPLPSSWPGRIMILAMAVLLLGGATGCKGKKKRLAEEQARQEALAAAEREAYLNSVRDQLEDIIAYQAPDLDALAAKEQELQSIVDAEDWQESDILVLIRRARYHLSQERERLEAAAQEQNQGSQMSGMEAQAASRVDQAFSAIANASSLEAANQSIRNAQQYFSSASVPVLIIISEAGDYDRPTTIERYLNYLKDQRRNPNRVHRVQLDNNGLIRELELIKADLRP